MLNTGYTNSTVNLDDFKTPAVPIVFVLGEKKHNTLSVRLCNIDYRYIYIPFLLCFVRERKIATST